MKDVKKIEKKRIFELFFSSHMWEEKSKILSFPHVVREEILFPFPFPTVTLKKSKKENFFENFELTSTTKKAFSNLKNVFFVPSVLLHFDFERKIKVETDASEFEMINIINQLIKSTDQWHFIAFLFKKKNVVEINYDAEESRMLTVIKTCK